MYQQFTFDAKLSANVTLVFVHYLKPALKSPSLQLRDLDPINTSSLNFVSLQVIENTLPSESLPIGAPGEGARPEDYVKFQEARRYFQENKAQILEKYNGDFIAILDNLVVDRDRSFSELAIRVYEKFGYQAIYMPFVESEPSVLRIPSPRVGKHRADALRKEVYPYSNKV